VVAVAISERRIGTEHAVTSDHDTFVPHCSYSWWSLQCSIRAHFIGNFKLNRSPAVAITQRFIDEHTVWAPVNYCTDIFINKSNNLCLKCVLIHVHNELTIERFIITLIIFIYPALI
jgi:uncharacterized protein YcgI (DUF1989 family)